MLSFGDDGKKTYKSGLARMETSLRIPTESELFICLDDFCIALEEGKSHKPHFQHSVTNHPLVSDSDVRFSLVSVLWL